MFLRFAYPFFVWGLLPLFGVAVLYRFKAYRYPRYIFPLGSYLATEGFGGSYSWRRYVLFFLRVVVLLLLIIFIGRPQWVDERSVVNVHGVDIVITLDVSESMRMVDDITDRRSRIDIAKQEAVNFIDKRASDPIGLVLFGAESISRCPLTLDKQILKNIIGGIDLGIVDGRGTALGTGLSVAISRLKHSKAKSKVVVLLTDGQPTPEIDLVDPVHAIDIAKQLGVKVYTVGIGGERESYAPMPGIGLVPVAPIPLNVALLEKIAKETGGQFFRAQSARDMARIYSQIDKLEKTEVESTIFHNYYEAFLHFMWLVFLLIALEYALRLFVWRGM